MNYDSNIEFLEQGAKVVSMTIEGLGNIQVLVADDEETTRRILSRVVTKAGYQVMVTEDGTAAWKSIVSDNPPDIVLLDWMMPGYSGPELCKMMKDKLDTFIYIILVTGKSEPEDLVEGLESGAHEFLSKPVNHAELSARLSAAVRIVKYERTLAKKNAKISRYATRMEELAAARARQLIHADRISTLGLLSAGIIHEINNSLSIISGNAKILSRFWTDTEQSLESSIEAGIGDVKHLGYIKEGTPELIDGLKKGVGRINNIIAGLRRFSRQDSQERQDVNLHDCIHEAMALSKNSWCRHVTINTDLKEIGPFPGNEQEIVQVLVNLIVNASHALENLSDGRDGRISISLKEENEFIKLIVMDNGSGIAEDILPNIWNPFFTTKEVGKGTGLGLAISRDIVIDHGGNISVENVPDGGAMFTITYLREH